MMGSFDAGFGTWYLEDLVGKKKAKEIWFRNPKMSAKEALEIGLINKVVPDDQLAAATREMALEIADRGAFALAAIKSAFSARHGIQLCDIEPEALVRLWRYDWPGNLHELESVVERMVVLGRGQLIRAADLPAHVRLEPPA